MNGLPQCVMLAIGVGRYFILWGPKHILNYIPKQSLMLEQLLCLLCGAKHNQHAEQTKARGSGGIPPRPPHRRPSIETVYKP